jgi:protein TonB
MGYQALLFCLDEKLARVVTQVFSELDFTVEPVNEPFAAVKKLMAHRYDAIVVDCENEPNATLLFKSARNSGSNQSSLALALVEGQAGVAKAYRIGANLVLTKPINVEQAKGTLRVARGLLRKNLDAVAPSANPASFAAPAKVAAAPPAFLSQPVSQPMEPVAQPRNIYEAPEFEPALPTLAGSGEVEESPLVAPAPEGVAKTALEAPTKVLQPEPAKPAVPVALLPSTIAVPSHANVSGAAAAPAPAKEAPAPTEKKSATQSTDHPAAALFTSANQVEGPAFAALGVEDSGSGSSKKIFIAVAALLVAVALGYFGWTKLGKSSNGPQPSNMTPAPASSTAQTSVAPVTPAPTSEPAVSTGPSVATPSAKPSPTISNSPTIKISGEAESVTKKPEPPPIVVKSAPAPRKVPAQQGDEAAPQVPSPLAVASPNDKSLSGLVTSVPVSLPKAAPSTVRISQGVSQGLLIKKVQPRYPQNALSMRIQGSVQLEATIDKEGNIANLKVVSGDASLARAATEAVRQWRYKPYYLSGEPVDIQTQITVNFKLPN